MKKKYLIALVYNGRKNIDIEYNLLNLPYQIMRNDTMATYKKYLQANEKLPCMAYLTYGSFLFL